MGSRRAWVVALMVILGMLLMTVNAGSTLAAARAVNGDEVSEAEEIEFTGTVEAVDEEAGTLVVSVETEDEGVVEYTVYPPEGFDWTTIREGDLVEVEGTLDENGDVLASKVKVETDDEDEEQEDEDDADEEEDEDTEDEDEDDGDEALTGGYFCRNPEAVHPVGARLADLYGVPYERVMEWFCAGKQGFGQIMLALRTAQVISGTEKITDTTKTDLADIAGVCLEQRKAGLGWGRIWKQMSTVGRQLPGEDDEAEQPEGTTEETDGGSEVAAQAQVTRQTGGGSQGKVKVQGTRQKGEPQLLPRGASGGRNLRPDKVDRVTPPGQSRGGKVK